MKLGIKVNADNESFDRLSGAHPALAEVWFNINEKERYTALFDELKRRNCDVGLHFWGMCNDGISPNIAYPDGAILAQSMDLMRQTIDVAAEHGFSYVNIHPGAAALSKINYQKQRCNLISNPVDMDASIRLFLKNVKTLHTYAKSKNVILTVETVPIRITDGWYDAKARLIPKDIYELPPTAIVQAANAGLWVANDFSHTAAGVITENPDVVWTYLRGITMSLAPQTRLIHIGFAMPPYNGTDNHDMLDNPILHTAHAVPNIHQLKDLLKLFINRDDVWILAEPKEGHVKNYFLVKKLLEQTGIPTS